jgi:hypothetical protein
MKENAMTAAVLRRGAASSSSRSAAFGRRDWGLVAKLALLGPLIGGAPYNIFVFPIPFSYAFGIVPSTLSAIAYVYWLRLPGRRQPGPVHRAVIGGVCGALGCAATAVLAVGFHVSQYPDATAIMLFCLPHGMLAGAVLGAWTTSHAGHDARGGEQAPIVPPLSTPWRTDVSR